MRRSIELGVAVMYAMMYAAFETHHSLGRHTRCQHS
jgi:hypothetical protein